MNRLLLLVAFLVPLMVALLLARLAPSPAEGLDVTLRTINASEAAELEAVFDALNYDWPPGEDSKGVPSIAVRAMPVDLHALSVDRRKAIFFRVLAPLVAAENRRLREQRDFLQATFREYPTLPIRGPVAARMRQIASRFNVGGDLDQETNRDMLLRRVDTVPAALVLAQAANESGWGTSRFAREANNLFGMWTWDRKAGLLPKRRTEDSRHFVRVFDDLSSAVSNYLHTINVGPAYRELRDLREAQRRNGETLDALALAGGLRGYSARGSDYVKEIRSIITYNRLQELPPLVLEPGEPAPSL